MSEFKNLIPIFEISKRSLVMEKIKITAPAVAVPVCRELFGFTVDIYETFFIIMLDNNNNTIGCASIGAGGLTGVAVDYRLILKYASSCLCTGIILVHNHPSGNLKPSDHDIKLTRDLQKIMTLACMPIIDHLIITSDGYFSFADSGLLHSL